MAVETKGITIRLADQTRSALDAQCETLGLSKDQVIAKGLMALDAQSWSAANPEWKSVSDDVQSHLDAVGRAFVAQAESKAEIVRRTKEESQRTVAALQSALADAQAEIEDLKAQLVARESALDRQHAELEDAHEKMQKALDDLAETKRNAVTLDEVLAAVRGR